MAGTKTTKAAETIREEIGRLVDELGAINVRLAAVSGDVKRSDAIKKELRGYMDSSPADACASFPGAVYVAIISARRMENTVQVLKVFRAFGIKTFLKLASITVKSLEDTIPLSKRGGLVVSAQTGTRVVTTAQRGSEALAKAA
jgi:hypothetical protein